MDQPVDTTDLIKKVIERAAGCEEIVLAHPGWGGYAKVDKRIKTSDWLTEQGKAKLKSSSAEVLRNLYRTQAGHCVTDHFVKTIELEPSDEWSKIMKRVGIIREDDNVNLSNVLKGDAPTNSSEEQFKKFIESALCERIDCKTRLSKKVREDHENHPVEVLTNIFVALNSFNIVNFIQFCLNESKRFSMLWQETTLKERTIVIENMKDVLKKGRYKQVYDSVYDKGLEDGIWTIEGQPEWGFEENYKWGKPPPFRGKMLSDSLRLFQIMRNMTQKFRYNCLEKFLKERRFWKEILGRVQSWDGKLVKELKNVKEQRKIHTILSSFASKLAKFLLEQMDMDDDTRNALKERMQIQLLDLSVSEILAQIGGPEPATDYKFHGGDINSVSYSPDGNFIVSGSSDSNVGVWDAKTVKCKFMLQGHSGKVKSVGYDKDGKRIVSGSSDKSIRIWDAETGVCLKTLHGHKDTVNSVVYSPDGKHIASGSSDKSVRIWDAETGECKHTLNGHSRSVSSVVYRIKGGKHIASGSHDRSIRIWDAETGELIKTLVGHEGDVNAVIYLKHSNTIISGGKDRTIRVWDVDNDKSQTLDNKIMKKWNTLHLPKVKSLCLRPDGFSFAAGTEGGGVILFNSWRGFYNPTDKMYLESDYYKGPEFGVKSLSCSPDGTNLVMGLKNYHHKHKDYRLRILEIIGNEKKYLKDKY